MATATTDVSALSGNIWTGSFWKGAGERAVKTFAQAFLATFGISTTIEVTGATLTAETWALAGLSGLAAAALSVVMSLANPSFVAGSPVALVVDIPAVAGPGVAAAEIVPEGEGAHRASPVDSLAAEVEAARAKA